MMIAHEVYHAIPPDRTVEQVLALADELEVLLPEKVAPFAEEWDIVILAHEIRRLRKMIGVP